MDYSHAKLQNLRIKNILDCVVCMSYRFKWCKGLLIASTDGYDCKQNSWNVATGHRNSKQLRNVPTTRLVVHIILHLAVWLRREPGQVSAQFSRRSQR